MKYCSTCGSVNLATQQPPTEDRPRTVCNDCATIHYQNPKIIVGCIATWEDKILFCRRAIEPRYGLWNLPAGFMENDETTAQGAAREVMEESGVIVDIQRLHSVYSVLHAHQVYMIFLAKIQNPTFKPCKETLESRLFGLDEIPWDEIAFFSNKFALTQFLADPHYQGVHLGDSASFKG